MEKRTRLWEMFQGYTFTIKLVSVAFFVHFLSGFSLEILMTISHIIFVVGYFALGKNPGSHDQDPEHPEAGQPKTLDTLKTQFHAIIRESCTSLSLVIGPAEQILKQETLDETYTRQQVRLIKRNSQKFLLLINQLLDISKLESKKMYPEQYRGDLTDFIATVAERFRDAFRQKHIRFNFESQLPVADYLFDRDKTDKIIHNLLSNASKSTPEKGKIHLSITPGKNPEGEPGVTITVQDTGVGIAPDDLPEIFDGFYLVAASTRKHEGAGTGLALTKRFVELMAGTIYVESEVGKGTEFTVFLPLRPVAQTIPETQQGPLPSFQLEKGLEEVMDKEETGPSIDLQSDRPIVQVIGDHADLRNFIRTELSAAYQVLVACDGAEGIEQALEYIPDLVICDVMMPEKVCDELKRNPLSSHIPIVLLTAKTTLKSRLKGFKSGADAYLTKPFSVEELTLRIRQLIATRKLLEEKYRGERTKTDKSKVLQDNDPDQKLIDQLHAFIEKELDNELLEVEALVKEAGMSHSQLYRKIKAVTHLSLAGFVREYRLRRAMELLREGRHNVTEVAYLTGFNNRRYFHKVFVEKYKQVPSEIRKGTSGR